MARDPIATLRQLAAQITAHTDEIAAYCDKQGHSPSSHESSFGNILPPNAPQSIRQKQVELQDTLTLAQQLLIDGPGYITRLAANHNQFACFRWLLHFHIPSLLPTFTPDVSPSETIALPYSHVAARARVPAHQLRRIARMAMLTGFLAEPTPGNLAHSPLSAHFAASPGLVEWGKFMTSVSAPMVPAMVEATERWGRDEALVDVAAGAPSPPQLGTNQTAYNLAWGTELPIFAHVQSKPELGRKYAAYMRHLTLNEGMAISHIVKGYDWAAVGRGADGKGLVEHPVVVDVGGGKGQASFALAKEYPHLRFVVQDLPGTIAQAEADAVSGGLDSETRNHVSFQAHDFFAPQPTLPQAATTNSSFAQTENSSQADVFLLRQILHDWRDQESTTILRNLVPRLKTGGRILIMDTVLPSLTGSIPITEEEKLRVRDLTMLQAHNAYERELTEWETLIKAVEQRLVLKNVFTPFRSLMAIIEIGYDDG